jgi:hypothetical protein
MPYYKRRVDHNQAAIVKAYQQAGYHVTDLSGCGAGVPDLLLTRNGLAELVEIKNKGGRGKRFTPAQQEYYSLVKCPVYVVMGINDVKLQIYGELQPINR